MARHNREGRGADQRGNEYTIGYQPDSLQWVKVTRKLESGRQSTKMLFRNPAAHREQAPGDRVRTRIESPEQGLDVQITVEDVEHRVRELVVTAAVEDREGREDEVTFTIRAGLPPRT